MRKNIALCILTIALLLCSDFAFGQKKRRKKSFSNAWKYNRYEVQIGLGVSNYLGELGGGSGVAKSFSPSDLETSQFKFSFNLGGRYYFKRMWSLRAQYFYGKVSGSDELTDNPERRYRNQSFQSTINELSIMAEYHLLRADYGHSFYKKSVTGVTGQRFALSLHAGLGLFYFNPKYQGVALQPLGTEGQGLAGQRKPYSRVAMAFPFGFMLGYQVIKPLKVGIDFTYRFTTTDYLDDVSGDYYDNDELRRLKGSQSAEFADRSSGENPNWTSAGSPRGNPKRKDSYFGASIYASYTPTIKVYRKKRRRKKARF